MGTLKQSLQNQVQYDNLQKSYGTSAIILYYNKSSNTASIKFIDPNSGEYMYRENVPLCITMGGLTGGCINPGQKCAITFVNNNIFCPVITGVTESLYDQKTSDDQGAYLVDNSILSCEKPKEIVPMADEWIDYDNEDITKYDNVLSAFDKIDSNIAIHELIYTINKYKDTEQGMTNPYNKSTAKVKDNGDIDIFAANNLGIRISPGSKTISLYGSLNINGNTLSIQDFKNQMDINIMIQISHIEALILKAESMTNDLNKKSLKSLKEKYYSGEITINDLQDIQQKLEEICS